MNAQDHYKNESLKKLIQEQKRSKQRSPSKFSLKIKNNKDQEHQTIDSSKPSKEDLHKITDEPSPRGTKSQIDYQTMSPRALTIFPPINNGKSRYIPAIGRSLDLNNPVEQIQILSMANHNY